MGDGSRTPPVVSVVGRKNSGKTSLTVALAGELNRRGHKVMTVKHGHGFGLDEPGKDSWRHRHEGGALRTVVAGPGDFGVVGRWPGEEMPLAELVHRFLWDADIVIAEGYKAGDEPMIEVFRRETHADPLYELPGPASARILAVVTDQPGLRIHVPAFFLGDPGYLHRLADLLERRLMGRPEA